MRRVKARPEVVTRIVSVISLVVGVSLGYVVSVRTGWFGRRRDLAQARRLRLAELYTDLLQAGLQLMNFTWPFVDDSPSTSSSEAGPRYTIDDRNADEDKQLYRLRSVIVRLSREGNNRPLLDLAESMLGDFRDCRRAIRLYEQGQAACEGEIERTREAYRTKLNQLNAAVRQQLDVNSRPA
jgi:hypothetical protein